MSSMAGDRSYEIRVRFPDLQMRSSVELRSTLPPTNGRRPSTEAEKEDDQNTKRPPQWTDPWFGTTQHTGGATGTAMRRM